MMTDKPEDKPEETTEVEYKDMKISVENNVLDALRKKISGVSTPLIKDVREKPKDE